MPTPTPFRLLCRVLTVVTVELLLQIFLTSFIQLWLSCLGLYLRTGLILPSVLSLSTTVTSLSPSLSLPLFLVSLSRLVCMHFGPQTIGLVLLLLIVYASFVIRVHSSRPLPPLLTLRTLSNCAGSKILAYAKL